MKISLFKLKKNRRFNYTPRYYDGKELGNPYDFDSKFSKYRDTYNQNDNDQAVRNSSVTSSSHF